MDSLKESWISVKLGKDLKQALRLHAAGFNKSMTDVVREAVKDKISFNGLTNKLIQENLDSEGFK